MKATYVYEVTFYGGAYGYDAESDAVVHSPAHHVYREELRGKGSLSRLEQVKRLEPTGDWTPVDDRPDLLERGRAEAAKAAANRTAWAEEDARQAAAEADANRVVLEHGGRTFRFWEAREGFYVSGLSAEQVAALEAQGLRVAECAPTYAVCSCGGFSKYRTRPVCEHCGAERKKNPVEHFVSTGEFCE